MSRSLAEIDRESVFHPFTSIEEHHKEGPRTMVRGEGLRIVDSEGCEYIDAMAGLWCVNIGYGRGEMADAIAAQARKLPYYHSFASMSNEPAARLAARLLELSPWPMARAFFGTSGSDANESQLKWIWLYQSLRGKPGKRKILSRERAYHGVSAGAASMTGLPAVHKGFGLPLPGFLRVRAPDRYREAQPGESDADFCTRLARELDETLRREGPDTVAALFAEPVMGAGGVIVPPDAYFSAIAPVLRDHDVLLVADEVICGFGRLGHWMGGERLGMQPDLVTLAKGLTSAYVPLSATLLSPKIWEVLEAGSAEHGPIGHGYTYTGHPVATAAALCNIDILEREGLVRSARERGDHLQARLREALGGLPFVGEVRGLGMIAGVELVADTESRRPFTAAAGVGKRLSRRLADAGLISRALGDTLALCPPLIASAPDLDEIVDRLRVAIHGARDDLAAAARAG